MTADSSRGFSRRHLLQASATAAAAALAANVGTKGLVADETKPQSGQGEPVIQNGRLKQSFCHWCYLDYWDVPTMCANAKRLGCESVELVPPEHFKTLKENGLEVIDVITESTARLIVNRASFHLKRVEMGALIAKLTDVL